MESAQSRNRKLAGFCPLKETHQFAYRFLTVSKYLPIDVVYNRVTLNAEWPSGFVMLDTDRRIEEL